MELNLMYVCKNKSTNYICCHVSVSQVAKNLGEYILPVFQRWKVTYMNGTSILMLDNAQLL